MKYLGIDYGTKNIGLAFAEEGGLAFPLEVLENNEKLVSKVLEICEQRKIGKIIVGESKNFKGEDNEVMVEIENFIKNLKAKTKIEIVLQPEFLTSRQAREFLGRNEKTDASAATIILQSYLDKTKHSSKGGQVITND